jgi:hypothetical protein
MLIAFVPTNFLALAAAALSLCPKAAALRLLNSELHSFDGAEALLVALTFQIGDQAVFRLLALCPSFKLSRWSLFAVISASYECAFAILTITHCLAPFLV